MKHFLARAYWLAGIAFATILMLAVVGVAIYGVLFAFLEIITSMVAGLLITAFLIICTRTWHWCDSYLKSSGRKDDKTP